IVSSLGLFGSINAPSFFTENTISTLARLSNRRSMLTKLSPLTFLLSLFIPVRSEFTVLANPRPGPTTPPFMEVGSGAVIAPAHVGSFAMSTSPKRTRMVANKRVGFMAHSFLVRGSQRGLLEVAGERETRRIENVTHAG